MQTTERVHAVQILLLLFNAFIRVNALTEAQETDTFIIITITSLSVGNIFFEFGQV